MSRPEEKRNDRCDGCVINISKAARDVHGHMYIENPEYIQCPNDSRFECEGCGYWNCELHTFDKKCISCYITATGKPPFSSKDEAIIKPFNIDIEK